MNINRDGIYFFLLIFALSAHTAFCNQIEELTLKKTIEIALKNNLDIKIADQKLEEQKAGAQGLWSIFLPDVNFEYSWMRNKDKVQDGIALFGGDPYNRYQAGFNLYQPLLKGGELWSTPQIQNSKQKISEYDLKIQSRVQLFNVTVSFYRILLLQEKIKTLKRQFEAQSNLISQARKRYRIGAESELTVLQFETQSALLKPQLIEAESSLQIEAVNFLNLIGKTEVQNLVVIGSLEKVLDYRPAPLVESNVERLPELNKAKEEIRSFEAQRAVLMSEHWPSAGFSANIGQSSFTKGDLFLPEAREWNYALTLKIPLFSGLDSFAKRKELAAQNTVKRLEEEKIRNEVSISMVQVEKRFQTSLELIQANKKALELAQRSYKKASEMFRFGTLGYRDFFDIEKELIASELTYNESLSHHASVVMDYHIVGGGHLVDLLSQGFVNPDQL